MNLTDKDCEQYDKLTERVLSCAVFTVDRRRDGGSLFISGSIQVVSTSLVDHTVDCAHSPSSLFLRCSRSNVKNWCVTTRIVVILVVTTVRNIVREQRLRRPDTPYNQQNIIPT